MCWKVWVTERNIKILVIRVVVNRAMPVSPCVNVLTSSPIAEDTNDLEVDPHAATHQSGRLPHPDCNTILRGTQGALPKSEPRVAFSWRSAAKLSLLAPMWTKASPFCAAWCGESRFGVLRARRLVALRASFRDIILFSGEGIRQDGSPRRAILLTTPSHRTVQRHRLSDSKLHFWSSSRLAIIEVVGRWLPAEDDLTVLGLGALAGGPPEYARRICKA